MNADKIKYPFQNTSLVNLSGEVWKAIPDFEGIYKISNYGRIKSLSKRIPMNTPNGGEYTSQEKIRKARLDVKMNKTIKQPLYTLIISLYKDGRSHHFSVARLVYLVFGRKYNLADPTVFISYKDHNGRNTHISNLIKTDISSIKLNSFKEGRAISHLKVLSKPITQFDSKGFPIKSFPSMYEAGKILGLHPGNIAEVVSGRGHMYKGFFWKSGTHNRRLNLKKIERDTPRERIHRNLLKRLKLRKVNLEFPPAFLNLSIESMKGEIWKDVPGYKGLYKISSFGRVKAMQKVSQGKQSFVCEED